MLPSEELRLKISNTYNIDLEQYKWNEEFKKEVLAINLDENLEQEAHTLGEIYQLGFNIGHCGLTSRYIARRYPDATLYYGTAKLLIGTTNAPNGEHAWTIINGYLIDATLMLCIPINKTTELGYIIEKEIEYNCARILSEYDIYNNEFNKGITLTQKKV